jgi:hypothetical protein
MSTDLRFIISICVGMWDVNIGTSGGTLPLNDGNITRSGTLTQTANVFLTGTDRRLGIGTRRSRLG